MHPAVSLSDQDCPKCNAGAYERRCDQCEDGLCDHECGEDCCACLNPQLNVRCDECRGKGWLIWCPVCGWDLVCNGYINGVDERERAS